MGSPALQTHTSPVACQDVQGLGMLRLWFQIPAQSSLWAVCAKVAQTHATPAYLASESIIARGMSAHTGRPRVSIQPEPLVFSALSFHVRLHLDKGLPGKDKG